MTLFSLLTSLCFLSVRPLLPPSPRQASPAVPQPFGGTGGDNCQLGLVAWNRVRVGKDLRARKIRGFEDAQSGVLAMALDHEKPMGQVVDAG